MDQLTSYAKELRCGGTLFSGRRFAWAYLQQDGMYLGMDLETTYPLFFEPGDISDLFDEHDVRNHSYQAAIQYQRNFRFRPTMEQKGGRKMCFVFFHCWHTKKDGSGREVVTMEKGPGRHGELCGMREFITMICCKCGKERFQLTRKAMQQQYGCPQGIP